MTAPPNTVDATVSIDVAALYESLDGIPHRESVEVAVDNAWAAQREQVITDVVEGVEALHVYEPPEPPPDPEQAEGKAKDDDKAKSSSSKGSSSKKK